MLRQKGKRSLLCLGVVLMGFGCSNDSKQLVQNAEQALKEDVDGFIARHKLTAISCDGEGKDFSKSYLFRLSAGKASCDGNLKEGEGSKDWLPYERTFRCEQNGNHFNCHLKADSTQKITGCVGRDGGFKLSAAHDLGFLSAGIVTNGNVKIDKTDERTIFAGHLDDDDGRGRFVSVSYAGPLKAACIIDWKLEVSETKDDDFGDNVEIDLDAIRLVDEPIDLYQIASFKQAILSRPEALSDKGKTVGATDCRKVNNIDVENTYLCLSADMLNQNIIFTRASVFSEGTKYQPSGKIISFNDRSFEEFVTQIGGHDIPGKVLLEFFRQAEAKKAELGDLAPHETLFKINVLSNIEEVQSGEDFVVITAHANVPISQLKGVISHETLHAQYFQNLDVQDAAKTFWEKNVTSTDQRDFLKLLSHMYDTNNLFVMVNEFLAYVGQFGYEELPLSNMRGYHENLIRYIETQANIDLFEYEDQN
ncbi:MAG: hypothetical protein KDD48_05520 [Bdellovibrionales bacterium]|nr:hypothetical protein [Bdellovibrionales bacterium]